MLTPTTLACATVVGVLLLAVITCLIGEWFGVIYATETRQALVGLRPI
jgi:hypothetical protein